jgi:hypothetical protein
VKEPRSHSSWNNYKSATDPSNPSGNRSLLGNRRRLAAKSTERNQPGARNTHQNTRGTSIRHRRRQCAGGLSHCRQESHENSPIQQFGNNLILHIFNFFCSRLTVGRGYLITFLTDFPALPFQYQAASLLPPFSLPCVRCILSQFLT